MGLLKVKEFWLRPKKNNVEFPLTRPTLFYSPTLQILLENLFIQSWKDKMKL